MDRDGRRGRGRLAVRGPLQGPAKTLLAPVARTYFRLEVRGTEHVPASGPVVLAANHESMWDVPLLVIACPRPIVFMAKEELFDRRHKDLFFTVLGGFPVPRGKVPVTAVKRSLATLEAGRVLGLYPEGTRRPGTLLPFRPGAAWLALREGVPVVPVGIKGTALVNADRRLPRRIPLRIAFGEPIRVDPEPVHAVRRRRAAELSEELRRRVAALLEG